MSRRKAVTPVVEAEVKPADAPISAESTPVETKETPAVEPVIEGPTLANPPADACEVWGNCDPNSKICKSCPVITDCGIVTNAGKKAKNVKASDGPKTRAPRPVGNGEFSKFGRCKATSQAGAIEKALEVPHTLAEIEAETGCTASRIKSHINWLVSNHSANCTKVSADGKIHFIQVEPVTAA
jgi:hypothetical protein